MPKNIKKPPLKVAVYARVARDEPGALDAQVARLRQVAASHGWTDVNVIAEVAPGGMSDRALRAIRGADIVFVQDLSRLTRRLDHGQQVWASLRAVGVYVVAHDAEPGPAQDPTQIEHVMTQLIRQANRAHLAERTRQGIAAAKARREAQQ